MHDPFFRDETLIIFRRVHPKPIRFAVSEESQLDRDCQILQWHWSRSLLSSLWSADHSACHSPTFHRFLILREWLTHPCDFPWKQLLSLFCAWGVSQSPLTWFLWRPENDLTSYASITLILTGLDFPGFFSLDQIHYSLKSIENLP